MKILIYIYFVLLGMNILTCIYFYNRHIGILNALLFFLVYTICNEFISWNDPTEGRRMMPYLYNIYFVLSMLFWTYFYLHCYQSESLKQLGKVLLLLSVIFSISIYGLNGISSLQNKVQVALSIHMLVLSIFYFVDIILTPSANTLSEDPFFWISCGAALWSIIFLFYAGPLFYFVKESPDLNRITYILLNIVCLINYSLLQIGLMSKGSKKKNLIIRSI